MSRNGPCGGTAHGNTAGLATMEDVVEEILGEIRDEHEPDRDVRQEADHVFVASGSLDLDRLHDLLKVVGFNHHSERIAFPMLGMILLVCIE